MEEEEISEIVPSATKASDADNKRTRGNTRVLGLSSQVQSNVSVSELPPPGEELHAKLRDLYEASVKEFIRGPY